MKTIMIPFCVLLNVVCIGISSAQTERISAERGSKVPLTLDSVLASGFAKQYGIRKQGEWVLKKEGLFNNELSVSGLGVA